VHEEASNSKDDTMKLWPKQEQKWAMGKLAGEEANATADKSTCQASKGGKFVDS